MGDEKIIDYDLAPSRKMDKVMEDKGDMPKTIWAKDVITFNSGGEIKIFGFTIRKGKK